MARLVRAALSLFLLFLLVIATVAFIGLEYAYEPSRDNVISRTRSSPEAYDLWGRAITAQQAVRLDRTPDGRAQLLPANGAVKIDDSLLELGRKAFYKETFGNELFLSDVLGVLDGPLRITNVTRAILALKGQGTTNLRVEVPETVLIGGRRFEKGSYFDTGLDVPRGALFPLGMAISVSRFRIRVGITCAACHATVDPQTRKVVEGAPNQDLNAGLLLALGTNSAAYFMHTDVRPLNDVPVDSERMVTNSRGESVALPNIAALEQAVDTALLMWPRGNFDSLTDMKADPTQNPISFAWGSHPYGWSGNFMAGPFRGLSAQNNNVHALNSDALLLADSSPTLLDMDKQIFLAVMLQNAASGRFRYDPRTHRKPSEFFSAVDPTRGSPGLNEVVLPPTYPKGTLLSPDGTLTSSPGYLFWQQNNAMAAWQQTLVPPPVNLEADERTRAAGRRVLEQAHCTTCHFGPFLTNNRVIPTEEVGANPVRSVALQKTEVNFASPVVYGFDTPVPLPAHPHPLPVPTDKLDQQQIDLAWAHHGSGGGYKVPTLVGLYWSAPYLHDGGVAVGRDPETDLGLPGTVEKNRPPDPANSLLALIDRDLRTKVVAANKASAALQRMNVEGTGHNYWIDRESGYSPEEQRAAIAYLLTYEPPQ